MTSGDYQRELKNSVQKSSVFAAGGIVFVLTALNLLVFASLPLRLTDTFWQLRFVGGLITNGLYLLVGAMFISLASVYSRSNPSINSLTKLCRQVCYYLAILYLVCIPLQAYLAYKGLRLQSASIQSGLAPWPKVIGSIKASQSQAELSAILLGLPEPRSLPAKLPDTFENVKAQIAASYQSKYNAAQEKFDISQSERLQTTIGEFMRNAIQSMLLFYGLSSVGKLSNGNRKFVNHEFDKDLDEA